METSSSKKRSNKRLTVILPVYKKTDVIHETLFRLLHSLTEAGISPEIICVIDGEDISLYLELRKFDKRIKIISHEVNLGKGAAIKTGLSHCTNEIVSFFDADLDINPDVLTIQYDLLTKHPEYSGVIADKQHPESSVEYPRIRRFFSLILRIFQLVLFRLPFKDTQTGAKSFRFKDIESAVGNSHIDGYLFDIELLYQLKKSKKIVVVCPVQINLKFKSTIDYRTIFSLLKELTTLRFKL